MGIGSRMFAGGVLVTALAGVGLAGCASRPSTPTAEVASRHSGQSEPPTALPPPPSRSRSSWSPPPTSTPTPTGTPPIVVLTQDDNGKAIVVRKGTTIEVELNVSPNYTSGVTSQDQNVMMFVSGSAVSAAAISDTFRAVSDGATDLISEFIACSTGVPNCAPMDFGVHVTVQS